MTLVLCFYGEIQPSTCTKYLTVFVSVVSLDCDIHL